MIFNQFLFASIVFLIGLKPSSAAEEQTCDAKDQTCGSKPKANVLIVVDMENSYCGSIETCPDFHPTVDGPQYTYANPAWMGPGCGSKCDKDEDCLDRAKESIAGKNGLKQTVPGWEEAVVANRKCVDHACFCDTLPSSKTVISNIAKIVKAKDKDSNESIWDAILFTHDWNAYQKNSNYQTLVAWTTGTEIIQEIADAVNEALPSPYSIIESDKVFHFVKQKANWGLARHQDMVYRYIPQGQYLPMYLKETILGTKDKLFDPADVQLTVVGSYTQYCVLAGVLRTMLSGYKNIIIPKDATGGYDDSNATPLASSEYCRAGTLLGTDGENWTSDYGGTQACPKPMPPKGSPIVEFTNWMADVAGGEGDIYDQQAAFSDEFAFSAQSVHTTKDIALDWLHQLGAEVPGDWKTYVDLMAKRGIFVDN